MLNIEDLKKDLEQYKNEQARLKEVYSNLTGAIQLLTLQIDKLTPSEEVAADDNEEGK